MPPSHPTHGELIKFASGSGGQGARAQLYKHLETCAQCRKVVESVREPSAPTATPISQGKHVGSGEFKTRQVTDLLIGATLGEYRVVERLGQGGMGVLYRGVQPIIGKQVAIKVVLAEIAGDPTVAQRMIDEARAVNAAKHRNIVDIFAFGQLPDGRPYMVMELLHGQSLAELLSIDKRLAPEQALVVLDQCFAGLEAAHKAGVIHRDLKPENIFVDQRAAEWKVTLLDFGLATRQGRSADAKLTVPGTVVGTPGFMSPEQVRGAEELTPQTDVYSMGVVAWTMLVGKEPFEGGSMVEVMHRHITLPAPPIRELVPAVPEALEHLVLRMMGKEPDQRPADKQVRAQIAAMRGLPPPGSISARAPAQSPRAPLPKFLVPAVAGVVALGLAAAAVWSLTREEPPIPQPVALPRPPELPDAGVAVAKVPDDPPPETPQPTLSEGNLGLVGSRMFWPCQKLTAIGRIFRSALDPSRVFQVQFEGEPPLMIIGDETTKVPRKLSKLRREILRCKGNGQWIVARTTQTNTIWGTRKGPFIQGGVRAPIAEVAVKASRDD